MNEKFEVGEIAIFIAMEDATHFKYHMTEVEIISPLQFMDAIRACTGERLPREPRHEIRLHDGRVEVRPPRYLRKRRPPHDWVKLCNLTDLPREVMYVDFG